MEIVKTVKKMEEIEVVEKRTYLCDRCGKDITSMNEDSYSANSFKVKFQTGHRYPDGGSLEYEYAYFCEECAEKVKELLIADGVNFCKKEVDW